MATRSTIAIEYENGTVAQIYCHWDGYLEHNGKILNEHYTNVPKIAELIDLGDLSFLDAEIGTKCDFDNRPDGQCLAYGRDRGETDVGAKYFDSLEDYEKNHQYEEFEYLFQQHTNSWSVFFDGEWQDLTTVLKSV